MLAMNIGQPFGGSLELRQCRGGAIDVGTRTACGIDYTTQQANTLALEIVFAQPGIERRSIGDIELGTDFGTLATDTHYRSIGTFAERQQQCIDEDGFAGTGFACQYAEIAMRARLEIKFETINDDEITNGQMTQHVPMFPCPACFPPRLSSGRNASADRARCHPTVHRRIRP